jgi:glycosyltransferase involved in cell wall biosynthesis
MRKVRCLVQHSVRASNGDCEGTPVAVLEAGASGLPVVATHHGGIPDVIVEGKTGFLVAERDIEEMARAMLRLAADPLLAANMGLWARSHIETNFSQARSLDRLWKIIEGCIR